MKSKLGMLSIAGKLMKNVVHLWRENFSLQIGYPNIQTTTFGFQEILGVNVKSQLKCDSIEDT
jgi:hypothetical protein